MPTFYKKAVHNNYQQLLFCTHAAMSVLRKNWPPSKKHNFRNTTEQNEEADFKLKRKQTIVQEKQIQKILKCMPNKDSLSKFI